MAGLSVGLYLVVLLATSLPSGQRWLARNASDLLREELGCEVSIGQLHFGLFNRMVLDDLCLLDQQADTLLTATRLSAKVNLWHLMHGSIRIHHLQLFGYTIHLHRATAQAPYNFQFLVDRFSSDDEESTPLDLAISSIIIRRGTLTHDVDDAPASEAFTPQHLCLDDLNLRASIEALTDSVYSIGIKHLSFSETNSGFTLEELTAQLSGGSRRHVLRDFSIQLPNSSLYLPELHLEGTFSHFPSDITATLEAEGNVTPADLAAFYPPLQSLQQNIQFQTKATLADNEVTIAPLRLNGEGLEAHIEALLPIDTAEKKMQTPKRLEVTPLRLSSSFTAHLLSWLSDTDKGGKPIVSPQWAETLTKVGDLQVTAHLKSPHSATLQADADVTTSVGNARLYGTLQDKDSFQVQLQTEDLLLQEVLGEDFPLNGLTLDIQADGRLSEESTHAQLTAKNLSVLGETIDDIQGDINYSPTRLTTHTQVTDPQYSFLLDADIQNPHDLWTHADEMHSIQGQVILSDADIQTPALQYHLNQLTLFAEHSRNKQTINLSGDFISAHIDGAFSYNELTLLTQHMLHKALPSLIPLSEQQRQKALLAESTPQRADFDIYIWDTQPLLQFVSESLQIPHSGHVKGHIDTEHKDLALLVHVPHLIYGDYDLRNVHLTVQEEADSLDTHLRLRRIMEGNAVDFSLDAIGSNDVISSLLSWDNHSTPSMRGELSTDARFFKGEDQKLGAHIQLHPTQVIVSDTTWNVHASSLRLYENALNVYSFQVSQMGRQLIVDGRISAEATDTLRANLYGINLEYIFALLDFDDVAFAGKATGELVARHLLETPRVDARLRVDNFSMNGGHLGELHLTGGFGRKDDQAIDLDAYITEPDKRQVSHVEGLIKPGHEPGRGMDLDIQARHLSIGFLNDFTESFLTDLTGNATGHAHIYGPFKALDLEGDLVLDTLAVSLDYLGHRYHSLGGDSIHMRPGRLYTQGLTLYDRHHRTSRRDHQAKLRGEVRWEHFKDIHYTFDIAAEDLLGYDFHDFGDEVFYGTVFANGNVHIAGQPGSITIDLQGSPSPGTTFTYNASTPETLTDNAFITFTNRKQEEEKADSVTHPTFVPEFVDEDIDLRLNFDLDVTPNAAIRLLMDARAEDYITLYGNGHLRATYFNKGRFQMYGTYRVDHGHYRMTLQDVLHKDFQFEQGGTIVFGGTPMNAGLNLKAIYTVPSVSLNELATGSNFSESNVRVNCLMNISGQAHSPQVSFDLDIPNVNEDVKQMVRSLISTDEERNMQVLYLLGIGRFYTYEYNNTERSQTNTAMNGLLSSTLSGQLSDLLANTIGNKQWNFGTNLSTGTAGWSDMDVEGILSGRLLNNRLIINGTFGYRDTPVSNTNFIGDFDVRWLLTPSGGVSLKAYSETNDRYFTKNALTTQGIGLQLKHDFNHFSDLFRRQKRSR